MIAATEYPDNTGEAKEKAQHSGFDVIVATDHMLQLDLDTAADLAHWQRHGENRNLSGYGVEVKSIESWSSKSGNTHILIHLKEPLPITHRIAIQCVLGSDRKREGLALRDVRAGYEFPLMLFKPVRSLTDNTLNPNSAPDPATAP